MTTPLTPEQVNNCKLWYDALRSGKYQPISPPRNQFFNGGCCCAVGVALAALGVARNEWEINEAKPITTGGLSALVSQIWWHVSGKFEIDEWSFTDCANFLHNHMLETYAVDLDDWPESAVAQKTSEQAAAL